jgi:aminoglycoside phosphotransferase (APT) family kinase protein
MLGPSKEAKCGMLRGRTKGNDVGIASGARDDEELRTQIERWVRARGLVAREAVVEPITRPAAGLSSDTCFVGVVGPDGARDDFVVRLPPLGDGLFPEYDLAGQVDRQNALLARGIPIAGPVRFEADASWLGAPFMVMPRVSGAVLSRAWLRKGFIADASPDFRRRLVLGFVREVASLHGLPATAPVSGSTIAAAFTTWSDYLDWAAGDREPPGFMLAAREWCGTNLPADPGPEVELWGDVQLTNAVFRDDGTVAALLDWEMTGQGPAELDLGWFLALHEMSIEQNGASLAGVPSRAEILDGYEAARGRPVADLRWFEAFALLRSGSIMVRMARLLAAQGVDDAWLVTHNPTAAALDRVI